jgi:hypothetical protein
MGDWGSVLPDDFKLVAVDETELKRQYLIRFI